MQGQGPAPYERPRLRQAGEPQARGGADVYKRQGEDCLAETSLIVQVVKYHAALGAAAV